MTISTPHLPTKRRRRGRGNSRDAVPSFVAPRAQAPRPPRRPSLSSPAGLGRSPTPSPESPLGLPGGRRRRHGQHDENHDGLRDPQAGRRRSRKFSTRWSSSRSGRKKPTARREVCAARKCRSANCSMGSSSPRETTRRSPSPSISARGSIPRRRSPRPQRRYRSGRPVCRRDESHGRQSSNWTSPATPTRTGLPEKGHVSSARTWPG